MGEYIKDRKHAVVVQHVFLQRRSGHDFHLSTAAEGEAPQLRLRVPFIPQAAAQTPR